jgi:hypothetical protein
VYWQWSYILDCFLYSSPLVLVLGSILDCFFGTGIGSLTGLSLRYWCWAIHRMVVSVLAVVPLLNCLLYYYWFFDWTFSSVQVVVPLLDCVLDTGSGSFTRLFLQVLALVLDCFVGTGSGSFTKLFLQYW